MNNTSRFKVYGILAAALIVVAGVVWFHPGKKHSGKASSARTAATAKVATTKQAKLTAQRPSPTSDDNSIPQEPQPTFKYASNGGGLPGILAQGLKLNDQETDQLLAVIASTRLRVCEILADNVIVTEANEITVNFEITITDEQVTRLMKEFDAEAQQIIGDDRLGLLYDKLGNTIGQELLGFGRRYWAYRVTGIEQWWKVGKSSPDDREPRPIAETPAISVIRYDGYIGDYTHGYSVMTHMSHDEFRDYWGKLAALALGLAKKQKGNAP